MIRRLLLIALLCLPAVVFAIDRDKAFDDPELQARYESIISQVRCVQCQNETIRDSNAQIADDLRREIRRLLSEGKSDADVYDFLVSRYGQFVLYKPRSPLFWAAPWVFLAIGLFVVVRILRKRTSLPIDGDDDADRSPVTK